MKSKYLIFILTLIAALTFSACTEVYMSEEENTLQTTNVSGNLEVHFIDVGQGDATLILCNGESLLIDGGNVGDSSLIYSYLKKRQIHHLNYMVATHVHEDHIGGLSGALNFATVGTAFCPVENYNTRAFQNWVSELKKQNKTITIPSIGDSFKIGDAQCDIIGVNTVDSSNPNNSSIVIKMLYGETPFLFSGDAEQIVESAILNSGTNIKSTVLKVPHHGSDTSLSYRWLKDANPSYAVISCGKNNHYGHPHEITLSKLKDAEVQVFRTDLQGDIICSCDGKNVSFQVSKNKDINTLQSENPKISTNNLDNSKKETPKVNANTESYYVLNVNTQKFHLPTCPSIIRIKDKNKACSYASRDTLIQDGFSPCQNCKP